ncbi:MAG: hypothetical protein MSA56_06140 [Clostridium sp.]|nr:hypothetical protein [Clostridium sp.]
MNKEEFIKTYNDLTAQDNLMVDKLYMFSCLKCSGFEDNKAYELVGLLNELWLKDETNTSISLLSDMLYKNYEDLNIENMTAREILVEIM